MAFKWRNFHVPFRFRSNRNDRKFSTVISKMLSITFIVAFFLFFRVFQFWKRFSRNGKFSSEEARVGKFPSCEFFIVEWKRVYMVIMYVIICFTCHLHIEALLTMNTNRFRRRSLGDSFNRKENINVDYLLGRSLLGNNPIFHFTLCCSFSMKKQKEFSQDHGIEGIKCFHPSLSNNNAWLSWGIEGVAYVYEKGHWLHFLLLLPGFYVYVIVSGSVGWWGISGNLQGIVMICGGMKSLDGICGR